VQELLLLLLLLLLLGNVSLQQGSITVAACAFLISECLHYHCLTLPGHDQRDHQQGAATVHGAARPGQCDV
jgi:hypothetical protein